MFGFCDDYDRVLKYMPFTIQLTRQTNIDCLAFGIAATGITFSLEQLDFHIEELVPKAQLAVLLDKRYNEKPLSVSFLQRYISSENSDNKIVKVKETHFNCPRYVFIACKGTTGAASQIGFDKNYSLCRHCDIKNVKVYLDGKCFPDKEQNASFQKNMFSQFYNTYANVCEAFSGSCGMTPKEFKELYTIFCVDLSDQKDKLPNAKSVSMSIEIERNAQPADNTVVLNPRNVEYFYLVLDEVSYQMDCVKKIVSKV